MIQIPEVEKWIVCKNSNHYSDLIIWGECIICKNTIQQIEEHIDLTIKSEKENEL